MTPDEIRELRCECGHSAIDQHEDDLGCWSCGCLSSISEALASALTERLVQAWDECVAWMAVNGQADVRGWVLESAEEANPYRSHADSGRSAGALSDEQGSVRVVGRGEGSGAQKGDEA